MTAAPAAMEVKALLFEHPFSRGAAADRATCIDQDIRSELADQIFRGGVPLNPGSRLRGWLAFPLCSFSRLKEAQLHGFVDTLAQFPQRD